MEVMRAERAQMERSSIDVGMIMIEKIIRWSIVDK